MRLIKGPKKITNLFLNRFVFALLVSILIILFIPDYFQKFLISIHDSGTVETKENLVKYADIDRDGFSEKLISFTNTEGKSSIKIVDHLGFIGGHWYFDGKIVPRGENFIVGPIDTTGKPLVFALTQRNDSLFLDCVEPSRADMFLFRNQFITKVSGKDGFYDYGIYNFLLYDLNGDSVKEVIISIDAGFSLKPRAIFAYDIKNNVLTHTPEWATNIGISDIFDINGDLFPEIFCSSYALNNYPKSTDIFLHDSNAWLVVLDRNLQPLFKPVEFSGYTSNITSLPFTSKEKSYIVAYFNNHSLLSKRPTYYLFDLKGNMLLKKELEDTNSFSHIEMLSLGRSRDHLYLIRTPNTVQQLDENFNTTKKFIIPGMNFIPPCFIDLDRDQPGRMIILNRKPNKLMVACQDFSDPTFLSLPGMTFDNYSVSIKRNGPSPPEIYIQLDRNWYLVCYQKNPWYYFKFHFYLGIYLVIFLFIFLVQKIQKTNMQKRYDAEKKISELQLLLVKNQVDPHFMFNVISSISTFVRNEEPEEANRSINRLSKLMRNSLEYSDKISRTLGEELEFVKNYLELEKSRLNDSFEFRIDVSPDVDISVMIPKMAVQIYSENAVKHGLKPKMKDGFLIIAVSVKKNELLIEIEDNGIGRKKSADFATHSTGKGLEIMHQYFEILNRYNTQKIHNVILDLHDEQGHANGTKVILIIPLEFSYKIFG